MSVIKDSSDHITEEKATIYTPSHWRKTPNILQGNQIVTGGLTDLPVLKEDVKRQTSCMQSKGREITWGDNITEKVCMEETVKAITMLCQTV